MAQQLPPGITKEEIERYGRLDWGMKKLKEEHETLNAKIKAAFVGVGSWVVSNVVIKRTAANAVDKDGIEKEAPYDLHPEYYDVKPVLNVKKVPADVILRHTKKVQRLSVSTTEIIEE